MPAHALPVGAQARLLRALEPLDRAPFCLAPFGDASLEPLGFLLEGGQLQLAYRLAHPGRWLLHVALRPRGVRGGDGVVSSGRGGEGADEPLRDSPIEVVVRAAGCDPLQSDGPAYRDKLAAAGVPAHEITEAGLVHGYLRARGMSARAAESFERILLAIEALGQGIWPYD